MFHNLCYTDIQMQTDALPEARASWSSWAEFLHRRGLDNLAVWILEAAGPLTVVGAQILYLGGPILRPALSDEQVEALAGLLENHSEALAFAAFLRKEMSS
jgi:hypothetical protein